MKTSVLREQTDEELLQLILEHIREVNDLRVKKGIGDGSVQPLRIRAARRELAQLKTIVRERKKNE